MSARALILSGSLAALLFGCAGETHSNVSQADLPSAKYRKLALFVENLDAPEKLPAEQIITKAFGDAGLKVVSSSDIFGTHSLSPDAQASLIRSQGFDAAVYVTILEKGATDEQIEGAWYDFNNNEMHIDPVSGITATIRGYAVKPDGTVYYHTLGLKARAELQDIKTAKEVWQSETIVAGHGQVSNMNAMFAEAAKQIVEKMRSDQAI